MCFNIFRFSDLHIYSHMKKHYQGNNSGNWSPLDIYQVYHHIQNTKGSQWWNTQQYFPHENVNSFIVRVLPRWNVVIHTVSRKLDIIDPTDDTYLLSILGKRSL